MASAIRQRARAGPKAYFSCNGNGAQGSYGGGGGAGGGDGGHGGFGVGGGAAGFGEWVLHGGDGHFGGGGGAAWCSGLCWQRPGKGGVFGGRADSSHGGGGALGGAIFNHNGSVLVRNSTFVNNYVTRGNAGGGSADNGADAGGAIFSLDNTLEITNSTFSGNESTGSGAAIVVYTDEGDEGGPGGGGAPVNFILNNSIIANNRANECFFTGSMNVKGAGNLIMHNGSGLGQFSSCPGVVTTTDPQLQPLQLNSPGKTPTMEIVPTSPRSTRPTLGPRCRPINEVLRARKPEDSISEPSKRAETADKWDVPPKPKGMRWRTYERLSNRLDRREAGVLPRAFSFDGDVV